MKSHFAMLILLEPGVDLVTWEPLAIPDMEPNNPNIHTFYFYLFCRLFLRSHNLFSYMCILM